ncbi:chemotaxis protein CheA [Chitinibacter bivalviorum]|uniref:Chemotaxis protein CheA n=1 Tax=Chitinibacter bivalviorum TaxID=2739434 RepID=A0A7H9BL59_9NEIS|nr:chemotaxis protein CheA [Chitinibacter bivalviorum]QLG89313.1 chemotaxis protein CheA [Chitinibacter bivalviorum]
MSNDFDHALPAFLDEANELLIAMESILMDVQGTQPDDEQLNAMFRAMHTIKGSSGLFGLDPIVHFTHEAENILDALRSGELGFDDELAGLLLLCHDHVKAMLAVIYDAEKLKAMAHPPLIEQLKAYFNSKTGQEDSTQPETEAVQENHPSEQAWLLSLRFAPDVLCNGMDPLSFVRYLSSIGEISAIQPVLTQLPSGDEFDPETNYLRFELIFRGDVDTKKLNDVFEFVREDSQIHIIELAHAAEAFQFITADQSPAECQAVAQAWLNMGISKTAAPIELAVVPQIPETEVTALTPEQNFALAAKIASGAVLVKTEQKSAKTAETKFIKVEASKLDNLINLIGELVIAGAAANLIARNSGQSAQIESTATIASLIEQIRAGTLSMRMVQIGEIFNRFPRVVRDVSKELGKSIELHISGAETELDKSMVDKLGDPLMHIVRNAIDHGIESAELREQAGKPVVGNVWLNAYHESGSIVIEVADDGGGLRKDKILAKAIANGLIAADAVLSDNEIYKLIFEPGFSTAEQVSNISGRGVGMDVVKRGLEALRGTIDIDSTVGEGTHFRIRLPLTLAIIDGFLVQIGKSTFVIPLEVVVECIEIPDDLRADGTHSYLNLRGEVLPVLNLSEFLELGEPPGKRQNVVVVNYGESKAGLLVDQLLGEFQTVIKPLGTLFSHLRAISGSTILGSGEVALILDVPSLIHFATQKESAHFAKPNEEAKQSQH